MHNKLKEYYLAYEDLEIGFKNDSSSKKYNSEMQYSKQKEKELEDEKKRKDQNDALKYEYAKKFTIEYEKKRAKVNLFNIGNSRKYLYPSLMICVFFISIFAPIFSMILLLLIGIIGGLSVIDN